MLEEIMDEIFEAYLRLTFRFIKKIVYRPHANDQTDAPLWVKIIAAILPIILLVLLAAAIVRMSS
jgi:hypothetical protein